jgi:hypothetical protein
VLYLYVSECERFGGLMKSAYMTIRLEPPLKKRVMEIAKVERRGLADQVIFLLEKGLLSLEQSKNHEPASGAQG